MYIPSTTEDFDTYIKADSREFEAKCEIYVNGTLTTTLSGTGESGQIVSMEWNNLVCSNDGLQIGTCCMDEFKMTYRNSDDLVSLMDKEIHPYVGLVIPHENTGDVTVWIPLGIFYVTNTETEDEEKTYTLTAYDGMQKFLDDVDWTALDVTFPINAWDLLEAIADYFGVTIEYDEVLYTLLSSEEYTLTTSDGYTLVVQAEINANKRTSLEDAYEGTYRDYIGWIVGLVGGCAHMGREGELKIFRYTDYDLTIPRTIQHMGGTKINFGGSVSYTNVVSGTDENPVYSTSYSGNAITYTNPYITTTELDRVCDELIGSSGLTITPCDIQWRSDPRVDAGDIVQAEDKDGNYFPVYVMERVMRVTGGLSEDLHCYVETEVQKVLNKSPMVTKMVNMIKENAITPAEVINNTEGTFQFIDNGDGTNGGFTIYESDGVAFLRCTAGGIGLSQDGGLTYTNAITKEGVVASRLSVSYDGTLLCDTYYDSYPTATVPYVVARQNYYDAYHGTNTVRIYSSRYESDTKGGYGYAGISCNNPYANMPAFGLSTGYFDDTDEGTLSTSLNMYDVTQSGRNAIQLGTYNLNGTTVSLLSFVDVTSGSTVMNVQATGTSFSVGIYDSSISSLRQLSLQTVTISGTTYYLLGATS